MILHGEDGLSLERAGYIFWYDILAPAEVDPISGTT